MREQCLELGRERDSAVRVGVVDEGLFAQAIPGQEDAVLAGVPQGQGEHAPQMLEAVDAVLLVGVDDGLGVRVGLEAMTAVLELLAEILEVVDLAVEDDADGAVFVVDRLVAAGDVDDGQAAHAQADVI